MKKILIIHAHPENQSFCSSLRTTANEHFSKMGYSVKESDLYAMRFDPIGDKNDFKELNDSKFFKYQMEQANAFNKELFTDTLKEEMDKLAWCDILIFNFPLWWFGLPAILKGWVDRVFAMGFVYGSGKGIYENGIFKDKTAFITMTTGGPEIAYNGGKNGDLDTILFPIHHGMFYFTGMTVLPPFVCFGPARKTKEELENEIGRYKDYLNKLDTFTPLYKA